MKIRERALAIFFALVFVIVPLTACGGDKGGAELASGADLNDLAKTIRQEIEFDDKDLDTLDEKLQSRYVNQVDFENVKSAIVVAGGGFIAEEILLFEAKDKDAASKVKSNIQDRFNYFKDSFGNYTPEQLANLEDPVLIMNGNYVFSVICKDNAKAKDVVNEWIKAKTKA